MRILQVNSASTLGGAETHVIELTGILREHGHEVAVAGRKGGPVRPEIEFPFANSLDIYSALHLRRFLRRNRFDIVHAHLARDYSVAAAALLGIPIKLVLTRHLLYPVRAHPLYRRVDGWIAPTAQILKTLAPVRPRMTAVIPNWVDTAKYRFQPHAAHNPFHIGMLGQISPHKGHDDAIAAVEILGKDYRLLIAGTGPDAYVRALRKRARDLPVDFLGVVESAGFFDAIDILVVPSWEEPFGIVLLEAMAAGVPVVATSAGGPAEILREGINGLLAPPRNPDAIAAAIRSLSEDDRRAAITRSARMRVEAEFDINKIAPRIEEFYRRVIQIH